MIHDITIKCTKMLPFLKKKKRQAEKLRNLNVILKSSSFGFGVQGIWLYLVWIFFHLKIQLLLLRGVCVCVFVLGAEQKISPKAGRTTVLDTRRIIIFILGLRAFSLLLKASWRWCENKHRMINVLHFKNALA